MSLTNEESDDLLYFQGCSAINLDVLATIDALDVIGNLKDDIVQCFQSSGLTAEEALAAIANVRHQLTTTHENHSNVFVFDMTPTMNVDIESPRKDVCLLQRRTKLKGRNRNKYWLPG